MPRWAYSLALRLVLPFAVLWFLWRGWLRPAYRGSLFELLALGVTSRHDQPLWLHAASVGEVQALAPLLQRLAEIKPPLPLLLTVGTPTGMQRARALYVQLLNPVSPGVPPLTVQLTPWDLPGAAARFLRAVAPRAAVFVETELWPNLLAACAARNVPVVLVSARVSARSLRRYQRFAPRLMREAAQAIGAIGAQSDADRNRFVDLGAAQPNVQVIGNLKFDFPLPTDCMQQGSKLRDRWAAARPVWVAGSTHAVEEGYCLAAQRQLLMQAKAARSPQPLLVMAPRRPERFDEVARGLGEQGLRWARSTDATVDGDAIAAVDVVLHDTLGGLLAWYAASDVAFVGGSLVPVGGHNLLEPAALGKPVLAGPHNVNAPEVARLLAAQGALQIVLDQQELAVALAQLMGDPLLAARRGASAAAVVQAHRGAADRALAMIAARVRGV